ncbi:hypothetical protein PR202_gb25914 [Eleusine coracana subsp. coracana]|uniref:Uncharacterized protein n=1 Tax=Eleusine coracana subsp. coracana TaxID=191504 RepID=A0AAV5FPV2_ELECO|nr:hypothetical protein PR202_gb25914 [Eleusine coracana subsp. coracana]
MPLPALKKSAISTDAQRQLHLVPDQCSSQYQTVIFGRLSSSATECHTEQCKRLALSDCFDQRKCFVLTTNSSLYRQSRTAPALIPIVGKSVFLD